MSSEKVTLAQAAGQVGVHVNTIKTWRRSGHLKSAELIIEHGVEVWHVDLDEAIQVAQSRRNKRVDSSLNNGVYPAGYPDNNPSMGEAGSTTAPPTSGGGQLLARPEQAMLELINQTQKPLLDMINSRDNTIRELDAELATVKERLRALEAVQTPPQPPPAPEQVQPVEITPTAVEPPDAATEPPRRGFLARLRLQFRR